MSTAGFLSGVVFSQAIFCGLQSIAKIGIAWCDMTAATTAALTAYVAGKVGLPFFLSKMIFWVPATEILTKKSRT